MDLKMVAFEAVGRTRHVETPHSGTFFADFFDGLVESLDQVRDPVTKRECIVLAKTLKVTYLKSVGLKHRDHGADLVEFSVGEDVTLHEGPSDRVIEESSTRAKQIEQLLRVDRQGLATNVFRHADGTNCVEGAVAHVAKILKPELDQVAYAFALGPFDCVAALLFGQCYADHRCAVLARRVNRHRSPSTADVE